MSYRSHFIDPVLFVRWGETTEAHDFDRIVQAVASARGTRERRIIYVGIIPQANGLPDPRARGRITRALDEVWEHCASIHIVIEGQGMRRALVRSVIAGLLLVVMKKSRRFTVHVDVAEALAEAAKKIEIDVGYVLSRARQLGVVSGGPP